MPNQDQIEYWNRTGGQRWVDHRHQLDRVLAPMTQGLLEASAPLAGEQILDVGCGTGSTTVEVARSVGADRVVGLDVSEVMLEGARQRAEEAGVVPTFLRADAQTASLDEGAFDLVMSRFGVMFFDDPVAAFANLHGALRHPGRLCFLCWQSPGDNPWVTLPFSAAARHVELPSPEPGAPGPFAFADANRVESILHEAGFRQIRIEPYRRQLSPGETVTRAVEFSTRIGPLSRVIEEVDARTARAITEALYEELALRFGSGPVILDAAAWLVSAQSGPRARRIEQTPTQGE